jgi:threonine/homoserine/homoserine lactone efflux protein
LYAAIEQYPLFFKYLNCCSALFILYLGYKIASSQPDLALQKPETPGFIQGFLMQWFNPKAWTACASGAALFFRPDHQHDGRRLYHDLFCRLLSHWLHGRLSATKFQYCSEANASVLLTC